MSDAADAALSPDTQSVKSDFLARAGEAALGGDGYYRQVLEALPVAVYMTDAAGRISFYNAAAAALWGCRPELGKSEWCGSLKLFWPDGTPLPHDQCPMALALKRKEPVRGIEAVAERPDGSRVPFLPIPTPLFGAAGELVGAVNMLIDLTDRKRAERDERRLIAIVESSNDAIISKDLNGIINSWNPAAERLFGYAAEETIGRSIMMLIPAGRTDEEQEILARIRRGERIDHYETVRRRKDGGLVEISITVSPIKNAKGRIIGASKIARDITERRRADERQQLLLAELKHRIKNTLTTVQAVARQTLRSAAPDEHKAFSGRIQTLAKAQDLLTGENWDRALLREVVAQAVSAFEQEIRSRFLLAGPDDVWLDANRSSRLTMALHELATNAVKYGALSNGRGQVRVTWELLQDAVSRRVSLCWEESGGPPVIPPQRKGFGTMLIERILEGEPGETSLEFRPEGVVCCLELAV